MIILLDNGHGFDTPGKRSPDGCFREYAYNRYLAFLIREQLVKRGLDARLLVPEREDVPIPERCRRVNKLCRQFGDNQVLLISIHVNAAGNGLYWTNSRGWSCYTSRGDRAADGLATALYEAAQIQLPGHNVRKDYTEGDPDLEENFYILQHTRCPAVMTKNLFMDNKEDVTFLETEEGSQAIVNIHFSAIFKYFTHEKNSNIV